jgi:hypothetical protein
MEAAGTVQYGIWMMETVESINAKIQAHVPEPVLASGMLQPAGTWGSFGLMKLSPAAGLLKQRSANKNAGQLSTRGSMFKNNRQTYFALTADKLYAFETKFSRGGINVLGQLVEWNRADLTVQTIPGKLATKVVIDHADGGHYELEATTVGSKGYNNPLLAELSAGAS